MIKIDLNDLDKFFVKGELIPAICYEVDTNTVLMLAYMNRESLKRTLETGYTWFWSRSRQEYWNKGATSGHLQKVVSIYGDCDNDTLLVNVKQTGVACHTMYTKLIRIINNFLMKYIMMRRINNDSIRRNF